MSSDSPDSQTQSPESQTPTTLNPPQSDDVETPSPPPPSETSDPLSDQFGSLNDLSHELASLQDLATRGSWRSVVDKVARARSLSLLQKPHDHLTYLSYNALALIKLRRFAEASVELDSLEDLDGSHYHYESYPNVYPTRIGSMVPFALRWLYAVIPVKLGNRQEGLDRLYTLLGFVRTKLKEKENEKEKTGSDSDPSDLVSVDVWKRREIFVTDSIIGVHLSYKEFSVCLCLIRELLDRDCSEDPVLISKLGFIQMQVGDLEGAKSSFNRVEGLKESYCFKMNDGSSASLNEVQYMNLVNRNKALVYLVGKDYVSAVREYDECIERDHSDVVALNNKALCLMYLRDLSDSIKVLENALERVPTVALDETIVVNLCSMYELAYVNHSDIKRTLSSWIARVAPDDFDSSCTRI